VGTSFIQRGRGGFGRPETNSVRKRACLFGNRDTESDKDHHSWGVASNAYNVVDPLHVQRHVRPPDAPRKLEDYKEWIGRIQSLRSEAIRLHVSSYEKRNVEITAKTSVQEQRKQLDGLDK
jgi:hypothetical protein